MSLLKCFGLGVLLFFAGCIVGGAATFFSTKVTPLYQPLEYSNDSEEKLIENARDSLIIRDRMSPSYWCFQIDTSEFWYDVHFHPAGFSYNVSYWKGLFSEQVESMSKPIIRVMKKPAAPSPVPPGKNAE